MDTKDITVSPVRNTDPETSEAARENGSDNRTRQRKAVLDFLKSRSLDGANDYETGLALGILRTSAGKRRIELQNAGLVIKTDIRRPTDTGRTAIVWRVSGIA